MEFISAYQSLAELSEKVELLEQEFHKNKEQLVVVTLEEQKDEVRNLLDITIKILEEEEANKDAPLKEFGLSEEDAELYNETIKHGGYVLLEKKDNDDLSTGTRDSHKNNK